MIRDFLKYLGQLLMMAAAFVAVVLIFVHWVLPRDNYDLNRVKTHERAVEKKAMEIRAQ